MEIEYFFYKIFAAIDKNFSKKRARPAQKQIILVKDCKQILPATFSKNEHFIYGIFSLYSEICTTERLQNHRTSFIITRQEWREILYGVIYTRL